MTSLCELLKRKEGLMLKLCRLVKYHARKKFVEKYDENVQQKLLPNFYLILVNSPI